MANEELIMHAREFLATPNLGKSRAWELDTALIYIRELADALEAAEARVKELEAAPEPEWEYGLGNRKSPQVGGSPHPEARARWLVSELEVAPNFEPQLVRRRPAGPWLPVEGESK